MLDESDANGSEKVIIETRVDKAYKDLRGPVPVLIDQHIAINSSATESGLVVNIRAYVWLTGGSR